MDTKNSISVIITTKDRVKDLSRFLDSLDHQTILPFQLVIVDASRDDSTRAIVQARKQTVKYPIEYIRSQPNLTVQRNIGIENSSGRYICFFDDDIVLDVNYLEVVHKTFMQNPESDLGGIVGRITNISDVKHPIDKMIKKIFFLVDQGDGRLKPSGLPEHRNDDQTAFVNVFSGCWMAYSRKVVSDFSFDENLSGYSYMEDIDFSYRVSKKYKLLYLPEAKCQHYATTYKTADSRALRFMLAQNHLYLFRKNLPKDIFHIYAFGMSLIGLLFSNAILFKDLNACKGIISGLMNPLPLSV